MSEGYEIDFLPVGKGKHSGDALALRWLMNGRYYVMVYDGGDQDAGSRLVRHIKEFYDTELWISSSIRTPITITPVASLSF
jgi:hypothetical protein